MNLCYAAVHPNCRPLLVDLPKANANVEVVNPLLLSVATLVLCSRLIGHADVAEDRKSDYTGIVS